MVPFGAVISLCVFLTFAGIFVLSTQNAVFSPSCNPLEMMGFHFGADCSESIHEKATRVPKSVLKLCGYVIDSNAYNMVYLQLFGVCLTTNCVRLGLTIVICARTVLYLKNGIFAAIFHITFF